MVKVPLIKPVIESAEAAAVGRLPFAEKIPSLEESEVTVRKARLQYLERTDMMLHLRDRHTDEFVAQQRVTSY